jgi:hypothetical protein
MYGEPLIVDDVLRGPPDAFLKHIVTNCETLVAMDDKTVAGVCVFNWVKKGRVAEVIGWVAPEYRNSISKGRRVLATFVEDMIPYAWKKMQAPKVIASCHIENWPAIRFAKNVGMTPVGILRKELQIKGQLYDTCLFECLNPAFEVTAIEVFKGGRQRQNPNREPATASPDVGGPADEPDGDEHADGRIQLDDSDRTAIEHPEQLYSPDSIKQLLGPSDPGRQPDSNKRVFTRFTPPTGSTDSE